MKRVFSLLTHERWARLLLAVTAFVVAAAEHGACAQQVDEDAEDMFMPAADLLRQVERADRFALIAQRAHFRAVYQAEFERIRLIEFEGSPDLHQVIEHVVSLRIAELTRDCQLTEPQVQKLQLAGKGDIKRLVDRLDKVSRTLEDVNVDSNTLHNVLREWRLIASDWRADLLGERSLVSKTLAKILTPEQAAMREIALAGKRRQRYEQSISAALRTLKANLNLSDGQSQRLARLLFSQTRPPKKFGQASNVALVLFQLSNLPDDSLRPIFDGGQWQTLQHWLAASRARAGGVRALERHGFVFEAASDGPRQLPAATTTTIKNNDRSPVGTEDARP